MEPVRTTRKTGGLHKPYKGIVYWRVNPKFCVKSISGANRAKFIYGGSGLVRLLPF